MSILKINACYSANSRHSTTIPGMCTLTLNNYCPDMARYGSQDHTRDEESARYLHTYSTCLRYCLNVVRKRCNFLFSASCEARLRIPLLAVQSGGFPFWSISRIPSRSWILGKRAARARSNAQMFKSAPTMPWIVFVSMPSVGKWTTWRGRRQLDEAVKCEGIKTCSRKPRIDPFLIGSTIGYLGWPSVNIP